MFKFNFISTSLLINSMFMTSTECRLIILFLFELIRDIHYLGTTDY